MGGKRKPRGGKVASTGTPRAPGGRVEATQGSRAKTTSPLSSRYEFIPAASTPPPPSKRPFMPSTSNTAHVKDYPPPTSLFQNPDQRNSLSEPRNSQPLARNSQPNPHTSSPPTPRSSHHSDEHQSPSFQAQNSIGDAAHSDGEAHSGDEITLCTVSLSEEQMRILTALLIKPGREEYTTVLSPTPKPGTTW